MDQMEQKDTRPQLQDESTSITAIAQRVSDMDYTSNVSLQERIDQFADTIYNFAIKLDETKRTIKQEFDEILELGKKIKVPSTKLSKMLRDAFHKRGVSESYVRKIMPPELRVSSHTNARYLPPNSSNNTIDINSSASLIPSTNNNIRGNTLVETKKVKPNVITSGVYTSPTVEEVIGTPVETVVTQNAVSTSTDDLTIELNEEIKNLRHELTIKAKQIQRYEHDLELVKQELKDAKHFMKEDSFVARTYVSIGPNDVPIRIVVNIARKEIESAEIDSEALKSAMMRAK